MLELTCVVLALSGLAASTPHGYGVKGGASSGAVAGASSGAFAGSAPGFPLPVPLGNGFSGSFSKSSSSSSSSSSASSSSSSSSFSYGGSVAGGLPGIGTDGTFNGGCTSGSCQNAGGAHGLGAHELTGIGAGQQSYNSANAVSAANAGANSIDNLGCSSGRCQTADGSSESATHGSSHDIKAANTVASNGVQGCGSGNCHSSNPDSNTNFGVHAHNNANAASIAEAGSILGSGCQGSKCGIHSSKCTSGNCGEQPHATAGEKCTSGYCGTTDNGPSSTHKDTPNKYDQQSISAPNSGYDCTTGHCGSSITSSPDYNKLSANDDIYVGHKPSTQLQAPHSGPLCTSGKCGPTGTNAGHRPSSYNVPIHGVYNTVPKPNCIGSNCDNHQSLNKAPLNNEPTSYFSPHSGSTNVNSPAAHGSPSGIDSLKCTGQSCSNSESIPALTSPSQEIPTSTICKTPGCTTGTNEKGTSDKSSIYGNSLSHSGHINNGQNLFTPTYNPPAVGSASSGCTSPNCAGHPSPSASGLITPSTFINAYPSAGNPSHHATFNTQPVFGVTQPIPLSQNLPAYNGGFGGPAGVLKPNEYNKVPGKPGYTSPGLIQNPPAYGPGTTSCNSPNCNGYSSDAAAVAGAHAHSQGTGVPKPNPSITSNNQPSYTGGFGGPTGLLKPTGAHSVSPGNTPTAIPSFTKPSGNSVSPGCSSYNCAEPSPIAGANANSFGASNATPDKHEIPYTGGFGGPVGVLKPHIVGSNIPATVPTQPGPLYNTPNQVISSNCNTGNCASPTNTFNKPAEESKPTDINTYTKGPYASTSSIQPSHSSIPGSYTPVSSISPSGCTTLNCAGQTASAAAAETNSQSVGFTKPGVTIPNQPTYTGGFPSTLKPGEFSVASPSHNGPSVPGCKSSNCFGAPAASSGAGAHAQSGVNQVDTSHLSEDELPPYKGGFGGPVGILKPNDFSVPVVGVLPNAHLKPAAATKPASCSSGVCAHTSSLNTHSTLSHGAQATAGSTANAEEISYTGSFGGPPGLLKPYESDKAGAVNPNAKQTVGTHYSPSSIVPHGTGVKGIGSPTIYSQTATSGQSNDQIGSVDKNNGFANAGADAQDHAGTSGLGNGNEQHLLGAGGKIGANSGVIGLGHSGASGIGSADTKAPWQFGSTGLSNGMAHAGAGAHASAIAGASSGAISGHNGYHNVKGGCGGGCGGSHSGSSSFGYSSGLGLARPGYSDGLSGSLSASGASAKSLSSAGAFGGSFATAQASAGAGVKGYGKR